VPLQRIALPQVSRRSNTTRCVGPCRRGPGAITSHGSAGLQRTQRRSASGGERGGGREAARRSPPVLERPVTRPSFLSFFSVSSRIVLSVRASRARARALTRWCSEPPSFVLLLLLWPLLLAPLFLFCWMVECGCQYTYAVPLFFIRLF